MMMKVGAENEITIFNVYFPLIKRNYMRAERKKQKKVAAFNVERTVAQAKIIILIKVASQEFSINIFTLARSPSFLASVSCSDGKFLLFH
jgi:hypothetical protein